MIGSSREPRGRLGTSTSRPAHRSWFFSRQLLHCERQSGTPEHETALVQQLADLVGARESDLKGRAHHAADDEAEDQRREEVNVRIFHVSSSPRTVA